MKFIIYHDYIPKVGGIESVVYNLADQLDAKGIDVTVCFRGYENYESLFRLARVAEVIKIEDGTIVCGDICLVASNHDIPKGIEAGRYLQWIHSDYDKYELKLRNVGNVEYIAVTQHCANVIHKREDVEARVIYNLLDTEFGSDTRPVLRLVTNSRVSPEKGFGRMLEFAKGLKEQGYRFVWVVYGDNSHFPKEYWEWMDKFKVVEEVQFVGYKSDITIGLTNADYLVQLSDFEGCPLAVLEALKVGVPCIVTGWSGINELIHDGGNGYILPMDMKKIDYEKIVTKIPKFEYKPPSTVDDWLKLIKETHEA